MDNTNNGIHDESRLITAEYTLATLALGAALFTHGYLVGNVAPYTGYMAMDLLLPQRYHRRPTTETVGFYTGWMGAALQLGRTFSSLYLWDKAVQIYGRVSVILVSLLLSCFCSFFFGMAQHWWIAVLWRFLL